MLICRVEIEAEIRVRVDELMREELKNLNILCTNIRTNILCIFVHILFIHCISS